MRFLPRLAFSGCLLGLWIGAIFPAAGAQFDIEAIPRSNDYILRTWDTEDGLPDLGITDITQTPDGYLWLVTWFGLIRFDGVQFTMQAGSSPSRPTSAKATAILTAKDGTLWAAILNGGLARLQGDRFEIVFPSTPTSDNEISSLDEDAGGGIWAGFLSGNTAIRWKQDAITRFHPSADPGANLAFYTATNGVLWFTSKEDFGFLEDGKFRSFPMDDRKDLQLGVARQGGVWAIRENQLLRLWENGTSKTVAQLPWIGTTSQATTLLEDREGNLWIGTLGIGLLRFRDGAFERVPTSFPSIQALYEDQEGNLWVGTRGGGLNCLSPRQFFLRAARVDPSAAPLGPRNTIVRSLTTDHEGRLWMSQGYALVHATAPTNRNFATPQGWTDSNSILSLSLDSSDHVWIAEVRPQLLCWKNGQLLVDTPLPGDLASFSIGPQDQAWVATKGPRRGVYAWRDGAFAPLSLEGSGIVDPVCLAWDAQKRLWIGTSDGQVFYREGEAFTKVPMPDPDPTGMVVFLVPDGANTVWIGRQSGLSRWHAGRLESLPPEAGFPTSDLNVLEIEPNGNFWFGLRRSLIRIARADLESAMEGRKLDALPITTYGRNNGIPSTLEFQFGFLHSSTRTPDGHLWFATNLGALEILPKDLRQSAGPKSVLIEDLLVGGKSLPLAKLIELPPRPGPIQIRYTLPQLSAPEQIRFRCRLLGSQDESWYPTGAQRSATFTNLPPGHYTFEVTATDPASPQPPRPATLAFNVQPAWWETLWFRLVYLLAGGGAIAGIVYEIVQLRMQARMRRLEQESTLERERARIARDMHDELGAGLTHVILMSESAAAKAPSPELKRIAKTARSVSSTLDQIVWMTNPRNDSLRQLVNYIAEFAEEYLADATIALRSELPEEVPDREISSEKRHHVLLVVKEALNNIAKHAGARAVHLRVSFQSDELSIIIQDDGRGFDMASIAPTSNGLLNMRQRTAEIAGALIIESHPNIGTTVTLTVKI